MPLSERYISTPHTSQTGQPAGDWPSRGRETELAKRIWRRCDKTSGIAILRFRLAFDRRHPLAGNRRLPLLDALQKRWGSADDIASKRKAVTAHVWLSGRVEPRDAGDRSPFMRFNRQPGGNASGKIEPVHSLGEKKGATARLDAIDASSGLESVRLKAPLEQRRGQSPAGAGIVRPRGPAMASGEKVRMTDPLAAGIIDRQDRESSQAARMEAPIVLRRKRPADRPDLESAAVSPPPGRPQEKPTVGAGPPTDAALQAKRVGSSDNARASFQPTTVKPTTDSSLQRMGRSGGQPMPIQTHIVVGRHSEGSGTGSAVGGLTAPAAGTDTDNNLAMDIIRRNGHMTAGRRILTHLDRPRKSDTLIGWPAPGSDPARASLRVGSENTVARGLAGIPVSPPSQGHWIARASADSRTWPRMMIQRTFVATGMAGSHSDASDPAINTPSTSAATRALAAPGIGMRLFDAMHTAPRVGRCVPSPAGDAARRPLLQLSASDPPVSAGGGVAQGDPPRFNLAATSRRKADRGSR
jgi:hypothetical protein